MMSDPKIRGIRPAADRPGEWRVRHSGRDRRISGTYEDAIRALEDLKREARGAPLPAGGLSADMRLTEYLPRYFDSRTLAPSSRRRYETDLSTLIRGWPIARKRLRNLTPEDFRGHWAALEGYIGRSGRSLAASSIASLRAMLSGAMTYAAERGLIGSNPVGLAPGPRVRTARREPATPEQVGRILAELKGHDLEGVYLLATETGMRQGEILGLTWGALDLEGRPPTVRIRANLSARELGDTKTPASDRIIPIGPAVVAALEAQAQAQAEYAARYPDRFDNSRGLVFTTRYGGPVDPSRVLKTLKRATERAGVAAERQGRHSLTFHDLRHGFATDAARRGVRAELLSKYLGHSPDMLIRTYYHPTPEDLLEVLEARATRAPIGPNLAQANGWAHFDSGPKDEIRNQIPAQNRPIS